MEAVFEFFLSLFIIGGAGFLLYSNIATELAAGVITLVTGYWFQKRSNESAVSNLLREAPIMLPITPENHPQKETLPPEV